MDLEGMKGDAHSDAPVTERSTAWKPKKVDDELAGTITEITFVGTDYGEKYVLNVRDEDEELWALWVDGAVLKNRLLELAPGVGSLIVVVFKGKLDNKAGTFKYNNFQVVVSEPNHHDEWLDAKKAFELKSLLKTPEVSHGGITAPGDDGDLAPF